VQVGPGKSTQGQRTDLSDASDRLDKIVGDLRSAGQLLEQIEPQTNQVAKGDGSPSRKSAAKAAGISDHVWSLEEIAALIPEPVAKKRGPYSKAAHKKTPKGTFRPSPTGG